MGTEVFLIRHAETTWNRQKKFQGHQDIELNKTGYQQAHKTASYLKDRKIDNIYSSDLKRAYNTARVINQEHHLKIKQDSRLRELNFGEWEGMTYQQIENQNPEVLYQWNEDPVKNHPPGGESLQVFQKRVKESLIELIAENEKKTILIVTHGGVIRIFLTIILGMSLKNYWQFNIARTAINIINFYGEKAIISTLNQQTHLNE